MDYDARFYVPALGRFSQPDTLIPGAGNPQNLNRYAYVRNNPLRYADPTGHWIDEGGGFATNKKKNGRLKIVSGRRVGNSDGDGVFAPPSPTGGGSSGNDRDDRYGDIDPVIPTTSPPIITPASSPEFFYTTPEDPVKSFDDIVDQIKVLEYFWDVAKKMAEYDVFIKKGFLWGKAVNPMPWLDAVLGGVGQAISDFDKPYLTGEQRFNRSLIVAGESAVTGIISDSAAGATCASSGAGCYASPVVMIVVSIWMDEKMWEDVNKNFFPDNGFGSYP